jgi:acetyl esterase/lipase
MLAGSVDLYNEVVSWYVARSGVQFLSVELRLAPKRPARHHWPKTCSAD